jgi:multicomponent Na+:H+ antiporter subunit F
VETVFLIGLAGLGLAAALTLVRLLRPHSSLADRIVALDTLLVIAVSAIAVWGLRAGTEVFTPVLLVTSLLAFVGTITVARYIERRGT